MKELRAIDLISNLDVDALARLVIAMDRYVAITEELNRQPLMLTIQVPSGTKDAAGAIPRDLLSHCPSLRCVRI